MYVLRSVRYDRKENPYTSTVLMQVLVPYMNLSKMLLLIIILYSYYRIPSIPHAVYLIFGHVPVSVLILASADHTDMTFVVIIRFYNVQRSLQLWHTHNWLY